MSASFPQITAPLRPPGKPLHDDRRRIASMLDSAPLTLVMTARRRRATIVVALGGRRRVRGKD